MNLKKRILQPKCLARASDRLAYWAEFLIKNDCKSMAEVGVWEAEFAEYMLRHCQQLDQYIMIDPWQHLENWKKPFNVDSSKFERIYQRALDKTDFAKTKRTVLRKPTLEAQADIQNDSLDFVYIDGDHTLRGITLDLIALLPKVKTGGYIAGDDFSATPWQHGDDFEPTLVFPYAVYFAESKSLPIFALGQGQFLIQNEPDLGFKFEDLTGLYKETGLLEPLRAGV